MTLILKHVYHCVQHHFSSPEKAAPISIKTLRLSPTASVLHSQCRVECAASHCTRAIKKSFAAEKPQHLNCIPLSHSMKNTHSKSVWMLFKRGALARSRNSNTKSIHSNFRESTSWCAKKVHKPSRILTRESKGPKCVECRGERA